MKTTSTHLINADNYLSEMECKLWYIYNLNDNKREIQKEINIYNFLPNFSEEIEKNINFNNSPCRILSDLFWANINYKNIVETINKINILDIGVGDGKYIKKLNVFSGNRINSYFGIDIKMYNTWENIKKEYKFSNFIKCDVDNIKYFFDNYKNKNINTIITQSAIEHFQNDLLFFENTCNYLKDKKGLQIHLFPAEKAIDIYKLHGFRQYGKFSLLKIINIIEKYNNNYKIFGLGGEKCFNIQLEYFNKDGDIIKPININDYKIKLKKYINDDYNNNKKEYIFYALVITSNINNIINSFHLK